MAPRDADIKSCHAASRDVRRMATAEEAPGNKCATNDRSFRLSHFALYIPGLLTIAAESLLLAAADSGVIR